MPIRVKQRNLWALGLCLVAALILAGYSASHYVVDRFSHHDIANGLVGQKTALLLQADSGYLPFVWAGESVRSDGLLVRGKPPRCLTEMRVIGLHADSTGRNPWQHRWTIRRLQAAQLEAAFGEVAARQLQITLPQQPSIEPPVEPGTALTIEILETIIPKTTIIWGNKPELLGSLRDVETRFYPKDHQLECLARKGTFNQAGWPQLNVEDVIIHYRQPKVMVESAAFSLIRPKNITATGELDFGENGSMDLRLVGVQVPADPFIAGFWKGKIDGVYDGECRLRKQFRPDRLVEVSGELHFTRAVVHNIATLNQLAALTGNAQFERFRLDVLKARYNWNGRRLEVANAEIEAKNLFRIEGDFAIENGNIDGKFRIGVVPNVLESIPGARDKVFLDQRAGYLWTTMNLTGPIRHPQEDLKQRLLAAAQEHFNSQIFSSIFKPGKGVLELIDSLYK